MPAMAAMPWPDAPPPGAMEPGKTIVRVSAAGKMIVGMGMKQNGVRPAIISSTGMPMVPRMTTRSWMKPIGNSSPSDTKNRAAIGTWSRSASS